MLCWFIAKSMTGTSLYKILVKFKEKKNKSNLTLQQSIRNPVKLTAWAQLTGCRIHWRYLSSIVHTKISERPKELWGNILTKLRLHVPQPSILGIYYLPKLAFQELRILYQKSGGSYTFASDNLCSFSIVHVTDKQISFNKPLHPAQFCHRSYWTSSADICFQGTVTLSCNAAYYNIPIINLILK